MAARHDYPDFSITLNAYLCEPLSDGFVLSEHVDYVWLGAKELRSVDWAEADLAVVRCIEESDLR